MVGEGDAEHVERLTLEVLAAGPQVEEARNGRLVGAHLGTDADPFTADMIDQRRDDLEAFGGESTRERAFAGVGEVVDGGEVDQLVESVSPSLAADLEIGLDRGVQHDIAVGLAHGCAVAQIDSDGLGLRLFGGCGLVTHVSPRSSGQRSVRRAVRW